MGINGSMIGRQAGSSLQREQRDYCEEFTDQHGRRFGAQFDRRNLKPVEEMRCVTHTPPWLPPMRNIQWAKNGFRFAYDYDTLANEWSDATAAYYQDARKFAIAQNLPIPEIGGPVDRLIRDVVGIPPMSPAIVLAAKLGDPYILGVPGAAVNVMLKALLEQHAGANGKEALEIITQQLRAKQSADHVPLVPTIPEAVEITQKPKSITDPAPVDLSLADIDYPTFVASCRGRKMTMPEIISLWKEHKAMAGAA